LALIRQTIATQSRTGRGRAPEIDARRFWRHRDANPTKAFFSKRCLPLITEDARRVVAARVAIDPNSTIDPCPEALTIIFGDLCEDRGKDLGKAVNASKAKKGLVADDVLCAAASTSVVFFADEARIWPEFNELHGIQVLRRPIAGGQTHDPSSKALERRWKHFKSR
jgi:hypothetical protein